MKQVRLWAMDDASESESRGHGRQRSGSHRKRPGYPEPWREESGSDRIRSVYSLLTQHAIEQMRRRGISVEAVASVLDYGRLVYGRGAVIFVLGCREVRRASQHGRNLSRYVNIHVVCNHDGKVLTAYRNRALQLRCS